MSADWGYLKLKDCCLKIGSGATPKGGKNAYLDHGEFRLIRSQNIHNHSFHYDGLAFISEEQAKELKSVEVQKDDVLLNITGDSVARSCKVREDVLPARVNQHVMIIRADGVKLYHDFLRYWLVSPSTQELLLNLAQGGATRNALTKGMVEDLKIPAMPFTKQLQLSTFLNSISDEIEILKLQNITLESIAQTLFKSWFVNFDPVHAKAAGREPEGMSAEIATLFPSEFEESEVGPLPKGWQASKLGDSCKIFDNLRKPLSGRQREKMPGSIPYYGATSVMDYVSDYIFDGEYLLVGEDGSVAKDDGTPFLQYIWGKTWVNNHAHVLQGANGFSTEALYIALSMTNVTPFVTGAVQLKINQGNLKQIPLIKPSVEILTAFNRLVFTTFACLRSNTDQIRCLESLRDELLPRLISGKIRIKEAEEALAEVMPSSEKQVA